MFIVGDKVKLKQFEGNPYGVVKEVFNIDPHNTTLIVQLENKDIIKCHAHEVEIIREEPKTDTITLTREEFKKEVTEVINSISENSLDLFTVTALTLSATLITGKLEKRLFGEDV